MCVCACTCSVCGVSVCSLYNIKCFNEDEGNEVVIK